MASYLSKSSIGLMLISGSAPLIAYSQVYMTEDQAVATIFPNDKVFAKKILTLIPDDVSRIKDTSGEQVRNSSVSVWVNMATKNVVFIDQVLGKHEFITFAVGISQGKVKGIEIVEYRETYGHQVRGEAWRKQFIGKDSSSLLKVNKDIINISGATLSSTHVTAGVRRILKTYEVIRERL